MKIPSPHRSNLRPINVYPLGSSKLKQEDRRPIGCIRINETSGRNPFQQRGSTSRRKAAGVTLRKQFPTRPPANYWQQETPLEHLHSAARLRKIAGEVAMQA